MKMVFCPDLNLFRLQRVGAQCYDDTTDVVHSETSLMSVMGVSNKQSYTG